MAKRKIIWSQRAEKKLYGILEFYVLRNKNNSYSIKLYKSIIKEVKLLLKHPDLGIKTTEASVRGLIIGPFIIYYEAIDDEIIIHSIWDNRQNPDNKMLK